MSPPAIKRPKKLVGRVRDAVRLRHYSIRTEETCVSWIWRYILFHDKSHSKEMGSAEIEASRSVTHLAVDLQVAVSTQNRALALCFSCTARCYHTRTTADIREIKDLPTECLQQLLLSARREAAQSQAIPRTEALATLKEKTMVRLY